MVTETKKGLDSIKIKAIQLHHMANDMLNYKGETYQYIDLLGRTQQSLLGSGDVTGDGLADILDVVIIVQAIIGNETLTDEQIGLADANFDGQVNILDAVILVNRIIS